MAVAYIAIGVVVGLLLGGAAWLLLRKKEGEEAAKAQEQAVRVLRDAEAKAEKLSHDAHSKSERLLHDAENKAEQLRREATQAAKEFENRVHEYDHETKERRLELQQNEQRLIKKEENLDRKGDLLAEKEAGLQKREAEVDGKEEGLSSRENELGELCAKARQTLQEIAGMSAEEAKAALVTEMLSEARLQAARELINIEEETKEKAAESAKRIISCALSRYAGEFVTEKVVSVITIPTEEMKGRIIGREGRNIRAFEAATGVDLIIDDTPEAVVVSGFSAVRREVARLSLEKLVHDGRIHPARIEEVVKKTEQEVEQLIKQAGERATMELNVHGLHPELVKLIGRLRYRTSYGQNVLAHSVEVAYIAGLLAGELGQNVKVARRAALLHDIGKAADQEAEGPHHVVGAALAKKFGETPQVVAAIKAHHEEPQTVLDHIIIASDALSGARPGARRELLESYLKRLEDLEAVSKSFPGVEEAYAFQAGREIRVLVNPDRVSDEEIKLLCDSIAQKIEQDLTYPGRVKVAVIRQTRVEAFAK